MKYLLAMFLLLGAAPLVASELSTETLQGAWVIVSMAGIEDEDNDRWEFEGNQFYQNLGGRRISPDPFVVKDNVIDLDYYKIKVLSFDGANMTANMAGFEYVLRKE